MTVNCDNIPDAMQPIFGDNCSSNITITLVETYPSPDTIIRDWVAEDECGNQTGVTQTLTVVAVTNTVQLFDDPCIEDGIIDLNDNLTNVDPNVSWVVESGNVFLNTDGTFDPADMEEGIYEFSYTVTDTFGCSERTEVTIDLIQCIVNPCTSEEVVISKAVTPNGDIYNEYFEVTGIEDCGFTIDVKIFNRWGALVFESGNYLNDWNGKAKSSIGNADTVPNGTYYYIVTLKDSGLPPFTGPIYFGTK
jgi:gliding motility-associated-like protein